MMKQCFATLVLAGLVFAGVAQAPMSKSTMAVAPISNSKPLNMTHQEKIHQLLAAVNAADPEAARSVLDPDYRQHNLLIPDKAAGLLSLFPLIREQGLKVQTVRLLVDGDLVVAHNFWTNAQLLGAPEVVSFDVFRIGADGKIAEHWDALMPNTPPNPSGRSLTSGSNQVTDREATDRNKATVQKLFHTIIKGSQAEVGAVVQEHFRPDYHQHTPSAADGIEAVFAAFAREQWVYHRQHRVIGEGNFVLSISEGTAQGVPSVFYDLLRFEEGKIVEHWDVIQAIPTENLANGNTMFGF